MSPERLRHWETVVRERFAGREVTALQIHTGFKVPVGLAQDVVWALRDAGVLIRTEPGMYRITGEEMTRP